MWKLLGLTIGRVLIWIITGLVFRALAALGFAYATYTGVGELMSKIESYVKQLFSGIPSEIVQILGIAKFDIAINLVLAALVARLLLVGLDKVTGTITAFSLYNRYGH